MSEGKAGTRKGRFNYAAEFKQRLAEAACQPNGSIAELELEHGLSVSMVHKWHHELAESATLHQLGCVCYLSTACYYAVGSYNPNKIQISRKSVISLRAACKSSRLPSTHVGSLQLNILDLCNLICTMIQF